MDLDLRHNQDLVHDDRYMASLQRLAEQWAKSGLCPDTFRGKPGDIEIVGYALANMGVRLTMSTLPQCYVVHGRPGYMAQLQSAVAWAHGYDLHPVAERCGPDSATVSLTTPEGKTHLVTFTMAEADAGNLTKDKPGKDGRPGAPSMYKLWPTNMLVARACTRAISWYCPQVKLGLAGSVDLAELEAVEDATGVGVDQAPVLDGEADPAEATLQERRRFRVLIATLTDEQKATAFERLEAAGIPAPRADGLTSEHVADAERIVYAVQDDDRDAQWVADARAADAAAEAGEEEDVVDAELLEEGE